MRASYRDVCLMLMVHALMGCVDFDRFSVGAPPDASEAGMGDAASDDGDVPDGGCASDAACDGLTFCAANGACEPRLPVAQDCTRATQCLSGFCDPDGICCTPGEDCCDTDTECSGEYRCDPGARECFDACTLGAETSACKASGHCSIAGNCVADLASGSANACTRDAMCAGNANCNDGFCCDGACGGCRACDLAGTEGVCTNVGAGEDPHATCPAAGCTTDGSCDGGGMCRGVPSGQDPNGACTPSGCGNDGTCNGTGACRPVASGQDPNGVCSGTAASCNTGVCNGSGGCTARTDGTTCSAGSCGSAMCQSGACTPYCDYHGEAACEYCVGDDTFTCGGC